MPQFLENKLAAEASKKGFTGKKANAYIYGTMNNLGAMHGSQITQKGIAMEKKHVRDTAPHVDRGHRNVVNPGTHASKLKGF